MHTYWTLVSGLLPPEDLTNPVNMKVLRSTIKINVHFCSINFGTVGKKIIGKLLSMSTLFKQMFLRVLYSLSTMVFFYGFHFQSYWSIQRAISPAKIFCYCIARKPGYQLCSQLNLETSRLKNPCRYNLSSGQQGWKSQVCSSASVHHVTFVALLDFFAGFTLYLAYNFKHHYIWSTVIGVSSPWVFIIRIACVRYTQGNVGYKANAYLIALTTKIMFPMHSEI